MSSKARKRVNAAMRGKPRPRNESQDQLNQRVGQQLLAMPPDEALELLNRMAEEDRRRRESRVYIITLP